MNAPNSANACALYCVYDDAYWLPYSVASIYEVVPQIYIFVSNKPWYGPERDQSATLDCIAGLLDPKGKIKLERGEWDSEPEQRNYTLALAQYSGFAYGLIIDADEVYHKEQLAAALTYVAQYPQIGCWHMRWFTYWKSLRYRIDPHEPYDPAVLIKLGSAGFVETRNPIAEQHELVPPQTCICHHLSYAVSDERLRSKHVSYGGHAQSAHENWYQHVWLAWEKDRNLCNLHPTNPSQYKRAVPQDAALIPDVLRDLYERDALP